MSEITLWGGLVREAQLRFTNNGKPYATFTIADAARYKDDHGEWQSRDESYTDVVLWGDAAEVVGTYAKGTQVAVHGRLVTRKWDTDAGEKRSALQFKASKVAEVVKAQGNSSGQQSRPTPQTQQAPAQTQQPADAWSADAATYNDETPF